MHTHNRTHTIAHAHTHAVAVSRVHSSFTQQALLDVYTIREEIGTVNGLTIAMVCVFVCVRVCVCECVSE